MGSVKESSAGPLDVAVIGLACRFPGGASSLTKFWDLLYDRKSAYTEVPSGRYNVDAFHHAGGNKLNTLRSRGGHFITDDLAAFDAPFFNITANEAKAIDPAARMLLEVTYEALENAGLRIEELEGSDTSCYVGCFTRDFYEMLMRDAESAPLYSGTGTGFSLLSNRLSWFYDFRGPSLTLDTACSSSLVGLHLACQSLQSGESKLAVVCGANLIISPDLPMWLSNLQMLSKDGLSRSFAEGTTGYGRGEGIATVILKPLVDALRDGDPIRSVIRGTGVNQDGHTKGITVPNSDAQVGLIQSTYLSAGLDFAKTAYFEAHGTGTAIGDPLELAAIARTWDSSRSSAPKILVGSVKSNIGHLEGAAGLAGLIKCILMLENEKILPNIHFEKPNPRIPFEEWKIEVPTTVLPWPKESLLRTSVNSFGYGGTNAHAIIDNTREYLSHKGLQHLLIPKTTGDKSFQRPRLFIFSARTEAALSQMSKRYHQHLQSSMAPSQLNGNFDEAGYLDRLSFTLGKRRSLFEWNGYLVASTMAELQRELLAQNIHATRTSTRPRITMVFTGQGAQWARMGLQLMSYSVFRGSVLQADYYLRQTLNCEWSVVEELEQDETTTKIQLAKISQPVCTILQVAIVDLLRSWSIKADRVVGHSSGEIAAAYSCGAISKEEAWTISYFRGKLCSDLRLNHPTLKGSMMAVGCSREEAERYVTSVTKGKLVLACVNSPESMTISGDEPAIDELLETLNANSVFARKLKVENAYHSHHMKLIAENYLEFISKVRPKAPPLTETMVMSSSVTGSITRFSDLGPEYWVKNLVSPVLFSDAVQSLTKYNTQRKRRARATQQRTDHILEIGPHAALQGPLRQILAAQGIKDFSYNSIILRGKDATKTAVDAAGALHTQGTALSVPEVSGVDTRPMPLCDLPAYPFNHTLKYWSESRVSRNHRFREHGRHDLLGSPALGFDQIQPRWRNFLRINDNPWIRDHVVQSSILYPGAGIIAMALQAIQQLADKDKVIANIQLHDVHITKAIVVPDDSIGVECFLQMHQQRDDVNGTWNGWWKFSVQTCLDDQEPEENAFGLVTVQYIDESEDAWASSKNFTTEALKHEYLVTQELCKVQIEPEDFYRATKAAGLKYGPLFQGLTKISSGKNRCCCTIDIPDTKQIMPANVESTHLLHPTTLDIMVHSLFAALGNGEFELETAAVPVSFDSIVISANLPIGAGSQFTGFCHAVREQPGEIIADIYMSDTQWDQPKVRIKGIHCRELPGSHDLRASSVAKAPCGNMTWKPDIDFCTNESLKRYLGTGSCAQGECEEMKIHARDPQYKSDEAKQFCMLENGVCKAVDLLAHKNPNLEILQIGGSGSSLTSSILSTLADSPNTTARFSSFLVADPNISDMEASLFVERFRHWIPRVNLIPLTINLNVEEQGLQDLSTDLIIVAPDQRIWTKSGKYLQFLHGLLREEGKLMILESNLNDSSITGSDFFAASDSDPVSEKPFLEVSFGTGSQKETLRIQSHPAVAEDAEEFEPIYVLSPPSLSTRVTEVSRAVANRLSVLRLPSRLVDWPPKVAELKSKPILSLLELESPFLATIASGDWELLKKIILGSSSFLWLSAGDDPLIGAVEGYLRVVRNENQNLQIRFFRAEISLDRNLDEFAKLVVKVAVSSSADREFVEVDGDVCISRWTPNNGMSRMFLNADAPGQREYMALEESRRSLQLVAGKIEHPESFYFTLKAAEAYELAPDEVEIEVRAMTISPESLHSPRTQANRPSSKEFSGIIRAAGTDCTALQEGDRVFACATEFYGTNCRTKGILCQQIPSDFTFEEAASWPITFAIAYESLIGISALRKGQTILIQSGACAVGQASIHLAKLSGASIFVTVGNEAQSLMVEELEVPRDHILKDNDPELADTIAAIMHRKGFDVILNNSKTGDALRQLWNCVAPGGILVDIEKLDVSEKPALDMLPFQKGCSFRVVSIERIVQDNPATMANMMLKLTNLLKDDSVRSVRPLTLFSTDRIVDAFTFAQQHPESGKVVVTCRPQDRIPISPRARNPVSLHPDATYVLAGGLGGLGRSLARFLVTNGARHLVLLSRSGPRSPHAQKLVQDIATVGVTIKVYACDLSDEAVMKKVVAECATEMPPIRGLIQSASVLKDSIYENMTHELWSAGIRAKIQGSWLLHKLLPKDMDFFVMLSSIAGVLGNRSQANYAAGNTYQDALARHRQAEGLPAVAVDLGLMLGIGMIAERGGYTNVRKSESVGLEEPDLHAVLEAAIVGSYGETVTPTQLITGMPTGGILQQEGLDSPYYFDDPRFSFLKKMDTDPNGDNTNKTDDGSQSSKLLKTKLAQCTCLPEALELITTALCAVLATGLQIAAEDIDLGRPLHSYGVDSLLAVEVRSWVLQKLKSDISLFELLSGTSIGVLASKITASSGLIPSGLGQQ